MPKKIKILYVIGTLDVGGTVGNSYGWRPG